MGSDAVFWGFLPFTETSWSFFSKASDNETSLVGLMEKMRDLLYFSFHFFLVTFSLLR